MRLGQVQAKWQNFSVFLCIYILLYFFYIFFILLKVVSNSNIKNNQITCNCCANILQGGSAQYGKKKKNIIYTCRLYKSWQNKKYPYMCWFCMFRALKFSSPQYINSLIEIYKPSRSGLRSSAEFSLAIPKSKRTWGDRAFASAAPHLWNSLPKSIHLSESVDIFKSKLKTHLMEGIFLEWRNIYFERSTLWAPWASFGWKCLRVTNICIIIIIISVKQIWSKNMQ